MNTDLILRKKDDQFILLHPPTGVHVTGKNLSELYNEMEKKRAQYIADVKLLGAADLLNQSVHPVNSATTAPQGLGLKSFFIKFAIVLVFIAVILQIVGSRIDKELKKVELQVRESLENPTPEQKEARMKKWKEILKKAEPYIAEVKKELKK